MASVGVQADGGKESRLPSHNVNGSRPIVDRVQRSILAPECATALEFCMEQRVYACSRRVNTELRKVMTCTQITCSSPEQAANLVQCSQAPTSETIGLEVAGRGRAQEAKLALEEACIRRFGTLRWQQAPAFDRTVGCLVGVEGDQGWILELRIVFRRAADSE